MAGAVHRLTPRLRVVEANTVETVTETIMAERLHLVDQAQQATDEAWDRVMMSANGGEPDQMDVLSYEMALNDLLEAKARAGF